MGAATPARRQHQKFFVVLMLTVVGILAGTEPAAAQFKPPPDRNGAAAGVGDNTSCPPGPNTTTKGAPDAALGDKDVNGDGTADFFMGEWKFVEGDKDLIVTSWCINKPGNAAGFGDFFSLQVVTSLRGVPTADPEKKVEPRDPT